VLGNHRPYSLAKPYIVLPYSRTIDVRRPHAGQGPPETAFLSFRLRFASLARAR
jgi:hypothetical protein